jgi:hypothetical protein
MTTKPTQAPLPSVVSRRAFISVAMAVPFLLATRDVFAQSPDAGHLPINPDDLHALSMRIIGAKADDRSLSDAFHHAFSQANPDFLVRAGALFDRMKSADIATPQAFVASALARDPVLKATAVGLTAAWYLGHVADDDHDDHGGGRVVAYEKALMWAPTTDITVIPSYSRGAPDYWAEQAEQIETQSPGH